MIGIIRREIRAYFYSPAGYVFTGIFWLLGAAFFFLYNILAASADVTGLFGNLSYLFMLIVPLLTMRLFSEERRQRTDMLYFCSPTPLAAVVLGKFLAAMLMLLIALLGKIRQLNATQMVEIGTTLFQYVSTNIDMNTAIGVATKVLGSDMSEVPQLRLPEKDTYVQDTRDGQSMLYDTNWELNAAAIYSFIYE